MTRDQFVAKAVRAAERAINAPTGWWGYWHNLQGPGGIRVKRGTQNGVACWILLRRGKKVSVHDSTAAAIAAARKFLARRGPKRACTPRTLRADRP